MQRVQPPWPKPQVRRRPQTHAGLAGKRQTSTWGMRLLEGPAIVNSRWERNLSLICGGKTGRAGIGQQGAASACKKDKKRAVRGTNGPSLGRKRPRRASCREPNQQQRELRICCVAQDCKPPSCLKMRLRQFSSAARRGPDTHAIHLLKYPIIKTLLDNLSSFVDLSAACCKRHLGDPPTECTVAMHKQQVPLAHRM